MDRVITSRSARGGTKFLLVLLLTACTTTLPPPGEQASLPEPAAGPPAASPCPAALQAALGERQAEPAMLALHIADPSLEEVLARDLSIGTDGAARCLVTLGPVAIERARLHRLGRERVRGEREVARRRRPNPDYRRLRARLRSLEAARPAEADRGPRLAGTGEPELDLLALAVDTLSRGLTGWFRGDSEAEKLRRELRRTPRWREEPIVEPYAYELLRYRGEKRGSVRVALIDREQQRGWRAEIPFRDEAQLALAHGRDPRDRTRPSGLVLLPDRQALRSWLRLPPEMRLSALLEPLLAATRNPAVALEADPTSTPPLPEPAAGPQGASYGRERSSSLLLLETADGPRAAGFYVSPELVLLPAEQLPDSALVPLTFAPGRRTYGILERLDDERELALVWVPRRGPPLELDPARGRATVGTSDSAAPAWLVPTFADLVLPGSPLTLGGRVVGVALDPALDPGALVSVGRLRRFLDRGPARAAPPRTGHPSRPGRGYPPGV